MDSSLMSQEEEHGDWDGGMSPKMEVRVGRRPWEAPASNSSSLDGQARVSRWVSS